MKKNYEDPFFEITRFSFEEMIMAPSDESDINTDGDSDAFG